jgi:hypothetical protein
MFHRDLGGYRIMSSANDILYLNKNNLNNLSSRLKSSANDFKQLSYDIRQSVWQLDWKTACEENINYYMRRSSDCANSLYKFLIQASDLVRRIERDLFEADSDIAKDISNKCRKLRRVINSSRIGYSHANRLSSDAHRSVNKLNTLTNTTIIPLTHLPDVDDEESIKVENSIITGLDWNKLGVNPFWFEHSKSNTINNYTNYVMSVIDVLSIAHKSYKVIPFKSTGVSVFKYIVGNDTFYTLIGKDDALKALGVLLVKKGKYRIRAGQGVSSSIDKEIICSDDYKNVIKNFRNLKEAGDEFRAKYIFKNIGDDLLEQLPEIVGNKLDLGKAFVASLKPALKSGLDDAWKVLNPILFSKGLATEFKALTKIGFKPKLISQVAKSSNILVVLGILIDIGFDLADDWGKWDRVAADVIVDIVFGIVGTAISSAVVSALSGVATGMLVGAGIGTCIPVPVVGTIVGAVIGIAVGLIFVFVTEVIKINGKPLKEWAKEGVTYVVNKVVDFGSTVVDVAGDGLSAAYDSVSSFIGGIFGGEKSSRSKSTVKKLGNRELDNQINGARPLAGLSQNNTSVAINNQVFNNLNYASA